MNKTLTPVALACLLAAAGAQAQQQKDAPAQLDKVVIESSADASKDGLIKPYAGGQVARGGRAGILGTKDNLETPFSITAYTNELIQDRQAKSVADVLQNDPGVRVARGFGNFQESYFVRGFILTSDDVAYNGLYSLLPRQYIATELFERVEVLRGASAFLMGASPSGGGLGGNINLLPKRAANEDLNRVTVGIGSGSERDVSVDISRRFGPDKATGVRFNAAARDGGTGVDREKNKLGLLALGLDWHSRDVRLSGDIGWQDNKLKATRSSITLGFGVTALPALPEADSNAAQPWSYSNEKDLFGTLRGEFDITPDVTAWAAYGFRHNEESNSLAGFTLTNAATGDGTTNRFDNTRDQRIGTGEVGLRGKLATGPVKHEWVATAATFRSDEKGAYVWDYFNNQNTNLYTPTLSALPAYSNTNMFTGNNLADPATITRITLNSVALGDTLSMLDDRLLLTLGLRAQKLKVEGFAYDTHAAGAPYDKSRTSPVIGAVYRLGKQVSLYANHIEGLSKGDSYTDGNGASVTGAPYVSKQNEAGVKYDAGSLSLNAAVFETRKPRTLKFGQGVPQGYDEHRGLELTAYGLALPSLKLLGGLTLLDTKQHDTWEATMEGKRTLGVPKLQANIGAEWEVPGSNGLALDSRLLYTGGVYADSANTIAVPNWTRLDAGARYNFEIQRTLLTARLRVDNLANKKYWASAGGYPDQGYLVIGQPRTVKLSLSADF
ncbi:TonB-dependent siderophore receptor [Pelomonas sp. KK5]|uniref:TonB-dependent receptor n=1 Tax=Pelomonas sp. KK5 TaxID=1855730 RepID=UPI00097C8D50|nr:TonB-dependent receptor [Pelomonas sp. KK5]